MTAPPAHQDTGPPGCPLRYPLHGPTAGPSGGHYARSRASEPVVRVTLPSGDQAWMVTRYEDVRRVLSDPATFSNAVDGIAAPRLTAAGSFAASGGIMTMDPPEHTRVRGLIGATFTARRVEGLRGDIRRISDRLLDGVIARRAHAYAGSGQVPHGGDGGDAPVVDLIEEYAFPLPMQVICELLGIPATDQAGFRTWSEVIVAPAEHTREEVVAAHRAGQRQITALITAKREQPEDDLLAALIQARDDRGLLSERELIGLTWALVIAGHETTVALIGSAVFRLLEHPAQCAALRADRTLLPSAVEEVLRYDGPVEQASFRLVTRDVRLSGITIPAGDVVMPVVPSANHDEYRFQDPATFDITRTGNQHLGFGHGPHFCPGAALARLETQIALDGLLDRLPRMRLAVPAGEIEWRHLSTRGPRRLPLTW